MGTPGILLELLLSLEMGVGSMEEISLVVMEKILYVEDVVQVVMIAVDMLEENQPWNIIRMDYLELPKQLRGPEVYLLRYTGPLAPNIEVDTPTDCAGSMMESFGKLQKNVSRTAI